MGNVVLLSTQHLTYGPEFKAILKTLKDAEPLDRLGKEAEISASICFLLSDSASYISGTTIRGDGASSQGNTAVYPLTKAIKASAFTESYREVTPEIFK